MSNIIDLTVYDDSIIIDDNTNDIEIYNKFTQMSQRMAFYAGIWKIKTKKFTISLQDAIEYGKNLPLAIELEGIKIESGNGVARRLTPQVVNELIDDAKK
jgi:hypothetical protein